MTNYISCFLGGCEEVVDVVDTLTPLHIAITLVTLIPIAVYNIVN